jgi:hypothetical protein
VKNAIFCDVTPLAVEKFNVVSELRNANIFKIENAGKTFFHKSVKLYQNTWRHNLDYSLSFIFAVVFLRSFNINVSFPLELTITSQAYKDFNYAYITIMFFAEARVRSQVSPCGICGGRSGTRTSFSPEYFGFPPVLHYKAKRKN